MPWLPIHEEGIKTPSFVSTDVVYDGTISGTVDNTLSGDEEGSKFNGSDVPAEIHKKLDEDFSGSEKLFLGLEEKEDGFYKKSSPILSSKDIGVSLSSIYPKKTGFSISTFGFMEDTIGRNHDYVFEGEGIFYDSFDQIDFYVGLYPGDIISNIVLPYNLNSVYSDKRVEKTSEEEVDEFLDDKEDYADNIAKDRSSESDDNELIFVLVISVFTAIVLLLFLLFRRREKVPTKFTAPEKS